MTPDTPVEDTPPQPQAGLLTVLREWGRIGCIGFGGPPTHIKLLRDLCVERKQWLDAREFEDAVAACNLLPGPASTQLAIFCAWRGPRPASTVAAAASTPCTGTALASLVSKGTITQAQATAIQNAMWTYLRNHLGDMRDHWDGMPAAMWSDVPMATVLRQQVSKGTMTRGPGHRHHPADEGALGLRLRPRHERHPLGDDGRRPQGLARR